jgi:antitoxin HicB
MTKSKKSKGRISHESFDDFLEEQGLLAEAEDVAIKRVLAWQIAAGMKAQGIIKTRHGQRHESRPPLARLTT